MESLTLTVAIIIAFLCAFLRPIYALALYITLLVSYPTYLMINIEGIHICATRIVITVLILKCLSDTNLRKQFRWCELDTCISLAMIVYVGMIFINYPFGEALQNRAGHLMDTWLVYIATRFCITDGVSLSRIIRIIALILVLLAALGIVESYTGWQPYLSLTRYCPWRAEALLIEPRSGLHRAIGAFGHPIMFGAWFAMFLPLVYWLRHEHSNWHNLAYWASAAVILGAISSMSSGPIMMAIVAACCLFMEHHKRWVRPLLCMFILASILIEVLSNRHFYHVILSYLNPIGGSWWHRARLIDCAIEHFGEWVLAGYGGQDPGWGQYLGADFTDVTNEFVLAGVTYGILGVIALCSVLVVTFFCLFRLYNSTDDPRIKSLAWAFGSSMVAVIVVFMSVSFFGQMVTLLYCFYGMVGSSTCITGPRVRHSQVYRHVFIPEKTGCADHRVQKF